jgi:hypothetical protein
LDVDLGPPTTTIDDRCIRTSAGEYVVFVHCGPAAVSVQRQVICGYGRPFGDELDTAAARAADPPFESD